MSHQCHECEEVNLSFGRQYNSIDIVPHHQGDYFLLHLELVCLGYRDQSKTASSFATNYRFTYPLLIRCAYCNPINSCCSITTIEYEDMLTVADENTFFSIVLIPCNFFAMPRYARCLNCYCCNRLIWSCTFTYCAIVFYFFRKFLFNVCSLIEAFTYSFG